MTEHTPTPLRDLALGTAMPETEHSPIPWQISGHGYVVAECIPVCGQALAIRAADERHGMQNEAIANAAFIVKAVNSHDRLIQALQFVIDGYDNQDVNHVDFRVRVYEVALDALASVAARPFYGAECPSYPNCKGGCGLGCTKEIERAKAHKATERPHD